MRRDAQAVLLLLIGGTVIKISLNGTYVRYVKVGLRPLLLVAGAVLIVVAAATLWRLIRPDDATEPGEEGDGPEEANDHAHENAHENAHEHGYDRGQGRVGWLLLVPMLALLLFSPPAVGAFQASRNGTALATAADSDFAPLPAGDPVKITVLDYATRAVFDRGRSLEDRRVQLTGFVIEGAGGRPYLARMMVSCCAADARPIKVGLTGLVPPDLAAETWIEVVGTYIARADRDPVNGETVPYLEVRSVREIAVPAQQYES